MKPVIGIVLCGLLRIQKFNKRDKNSSELDLIYLFCEDSTVNLIPSFSGTLPFVFRGRKKKEPVV